MIRVLTVSLVLLPALTAGGCLNQLARRDPVPAPAVAVAPAPALPAPSVGRRRVAAAPAEPAPNTSAASWQMPWQISPIAGASQAAGEEIVQTVLPATGVVRGTRTALAGIGRPLAAAPGSNRTVGACLNVVQSEAAKVGAKEVEAVSAGTEHRDRQGRYFAPVRLRVTYVRPSGYEVRESTLTCIVDRGGKIVDAYV